jgi:hypothetical protein
MTNPPMNQTSDITTTGINWRLGTFRLWIIVSGLWSAVVFSVMLTNRNIIWSPSNSPATVHVKISDTETWDYPTDWGVQRIEEDLKKRLAAKDEKEREWAAQLPAARKAQCRAIPPTTAFDDQPADCVRFYFADGGFISGVPNGWEAQVKAPSAPAWSVIATAMPWAVGPPLVVLALGASLFWAFAGFSLGSTNPPPGI